MSPEKGLSASAQRRLKASWAEHFRQKVMPELLASEEAFSVLYGDGGRPNWSVARLLGVCLLQQFQDMTDQQALDALSFDIRWQHALDLVNDDAYLSRRSLVEFRQRLVQHDPQDTLLRGVFDRICGAGVEDLGISTSEQRLDSTLVASNIRAHGRLSLARETLRMFVRSLDDAQRANLPEAVCAWHASTHGDSWDAQDKASDKQARLHEVGCLVATTLVVFAQDEHIVSSEPYRVLQRLADEHGEALGLLPTQASNRDEPDDDPPAGPGADAQTERAKRNKPPKTSRTTPHQARYWSPHD